MCSVSVFSVLSNMQMPVFSIERVTDDNCGHAGAGTYWDTHRTVGLVICRTVGQVIVRTDDNCGHVGAGTYYWDTHRTVGQVICRTLGQAIGRTDDNCGHAGAGTHIGHRDL